MIELSWQRRLPPLAPVAVVATGDAGAGLRTVTADRLEAGAELRVSAGDGWLLVLADDAESLPWSDGVAYLGRDGGLLVPTTMRPSPDAAALQEMLPGADLVAVIPGHVLLSPMPARTADPHVVRTAG